MFHGITGHVDLPAMALPCQVCVYHCRRVPWRMGFGVYNSRDFKKDAQKLDVVGSPFISWVEFDSPLLCGVFFCGITGDARRVFQLLQSREVMAGVCAVFWVNKLTFNLWNLGAGGNWCRGVGWNLKGQNLPWERQLFFWESRRLNSSKIGRGLKCMSQPSALSWLHPVALPCQLRTPCKDFCVNLGFNVSMGLNFGFFKG